MLVVVLSTPYPALARGAKTMKIKNGVLYEAYQVLQKNVISLKQVPSRKAHAIAKLVVQMEPHVQAVDLVRNKIVEECTMKDETTGQPVPVLDANKEPIPGRIQLTADGTKRYADLMIEESVVAIDKLPFDVLDDLEIPDPVVTFITLRDFIEEPNGENRVDGAVERAG